MHVLCYGLYGFPRAIDGVAASQIGQRARRLGEGGRTARPAGLLSECLGDHGLSHSNEAIQDDRLAVGHKTQRGEVADVGGGDLGIEEVEVLERAGLLKVRGSDALDDGCGAPGDPGARASKVSSVSERRRAFRVASSWWVEFEHAFAERDDLAA